MISVRLFDQLGLWWERWMDWAIMQPVMAPSARGAACTMATCDGGSPFLQWRVIKRPRPYLGSSLVLLHSSSLVHVASAARQPANSVVRSLRKELGPADGDSQGRLAQQ